MHLRCSIYKEICYMVPASRTLDNSDHNGITCRQCLDVSPAARCTAAPPSPADIRTNGNEQQDRQGCALTKPHSQPILTSQTEHSGHVSTNILVTGSDLLTTFIHAPTSSARAYPKANRTWSNLIYKCKLRCRTALPLHFTHT